jgi:short-subunit dehydrogenase
MSSDGISLHSRYGPWALVAGGSDGIGEAFARQLAASGLGVVLLARRQETLQVLAEELQARGAAVRAAAVDLTSSDLMDRVKQVTHGLDIGLLVYNAGADQASGTFTERSVEQALGLTYLNCRGPILLAHHFARHMAERGSGGIVIVTAMGAVAGAAGMAVYSGTKAFELNFAEGLWAELQPRGVDVLACVAGATRTPSLLKTGARLEGFFMMEPHEVAAEALAHIADGPMWVAGEGNREIAARFWPVPRVEFVRRLSARNAQMMGRVPQERR